MDDRTTKLDRLNIFIRCFFVQASWNFKSLLGLGFCFCVIPIARRFYKTREEKSEFLKRHLEFFNAHPYFASWCVGAVTRLEEEAVQKDWPDESPISIFKSRLTGPLGAIGDQIFWTRVKPAASALGLCLALLVGWIAIPIYLVVYNIPHLFVRIHGMKLGYHKGFDLVSNVSIRRFQKIADRISKAGLVLAGVLISIAAGWSLKHDVSSLIAFLVAVAISFLLLNMKKSNTFIIFTVYFISILLGLLFFLL